MNLDCMIKRTLLAQTPLIHFQPYESGATLRATEVKPKLDKYLAKCYRADHNGAEIPVAWKMPEQQQALAYKLQLVAGSDGEIVEIGYQKGTENAYDIFYGNMGNGTPQKKGVIRDINLTILCASPTLKSFIEAHLADFFIATNFGTMQNKGFGSFLVKEDNKPVNAARIASVLKAAYDAPTCYSFFGGRLPFKAIKTVYSLMKSGINLKRVNPDKFKRSMLFDYMAKEAHIGNEKAWLKKNHMVPTLGQTGQPCPYPPHYVRALLGVCDHVEYLTSFKPHSPKLQVSISGVTKNGDKIERLSSPIFFKVIQSNVYYVRKRIPEQIYGATFTFKGYTAQTLTVPEKEAIGDDFIDRFLAYSMEDFNNNCPKSLKGKLVIEEVKTV